MRVSVIPGRRILIRVGIVTRGRKNLRCASLVRVYAQQLERADLAVPRKFVARELSGTTARLRWAVVPNAFAYRVFKDGAVVTQTDRVVMDVPVVAGREYTFQVAAVDRAGRLGPMSRISALTTSVRPPSAPTGLTAIATNDGAYLVSWKAAVRGTAPLVGYRVTRNGEVLGQTRGTQWKVTGLEAGKTYRIEIRSVDSLGELSAASAPLNIELDPPPPTRGHARAFLLASTDRSFEDFQINYMNIGRIYPTYFDCTAAAGFIGKDDPRITQWAQVRQVEVLPRLNCQSSAVLHRILTEPAMREWWLNKIVTLVRQNGYQGINLDFEKGLWSDRDALTGFVTELSSRLHAEGRLLSMELSSKVNDDNKQHPRSGIFDYPALGRVLDEGLIMVWGFHWTTSGPGAVSPLWWIDGVAKYAASMPNSDRFVIGTPMYATDWPPNAGTSNPAKALEYSDVTALIARTGAVPQRDAESGELFFTYQASDGRHEVWFLDVEAVRQKHAAAAARGITQNFVWRLGEEDERVWTLPSLGGTG